MAGTQRAGSSATRAAKRHWADLPLIAICGALASAGMAITAWTLPGVPADATADAPSPSIEQPVRSEDVQGEVIGSYQAISQSTDPDRAENLRLAAEAVDGTVIEPGETFSFNECVGDVEQDSRYREASVISGGETVDGAGGGICQVSTALYIASLKADMEIVERHPHSVASDYAPIGLDATLVYGVMDLKIKNAGDAPVRIEASAMGQTVEVSIVGQPLADGVTVDATSKVVGQYTDDEPGSEPHLHYATESYRVYYRDGMMQRSDLLSSDVYLVPERSAVVLSEGSVEFTK